MNWLLTLLQNANLSKSTTYAGLAYMLAKYGGAIAMKRFPAYTAEISNAVDAIEGFAIVYLGANARSEGAAKESKADLDAKLEELRQAAVSGDTTHLTKPPTEPKTT